MKYCLNPNAKEIVKEVLFDLFIGSTTTFILITMVALPCAMGGDITAIT